MDKIKRLESHIEALEKSYENIIQMLNEDIEVNKETEKVALKDSQRKVYAEGIQKSAETANSLLQMIDQKTLELEAIKNESKKTPKQEKEIQENKVNEQYPTQDYLK